MTPPTPPIDPALFDEATAASDDFYRHANGGWLDANPVPSEYPAWGAFLEVHVRNEEILHEILIEASEASSPKGSPSQIVGDYFAAGMDEAAIAAASVGDLTPLLDAIDSVEDIDDLRECLPSLRRVGIGGFHRIGIQPDFEHASRYLVYLGQGGLGLPERDYYLRDDEQSETLVEAYRAHVAAQLGNLGVGGEEEATDVVAFEKRLAGSSYPAEKLRDLSLTMNRHQVDDLDELMPGLRLTTYMRDLGVTSESVSVDNPGFFTDLEEVIAGTPTETIRHYLRWHLVKTFAPALTPDFEDEAFDFYGRRLGGQKQKRARWTRVLAAASSDIGELVGRLYVDAAFSPEAKARCEQMVEGLIKAMERSIEHLDWMTEATKEAALIKVKRFGHKIGYPDVWRDYSKLTVGRDSHVGNRMRCSIFEFERRMGRLDEDVDKSEWEMPAHSVNAYYTPLLNEIVFPAGILQPPFFYPDADDAVNYGGIGAVIGHEITHGFDDNGSRFDENGRRRNWWTDDDRAEFERRARVLVEQFSDYDAAEGQKVNGQLTLGENIADLGGVALAYDAFVNSLRDDEEIDGYSPVQRFFLAYATIWRTNYTEEYLRMMANVDPHSPNRYRVNGPLSNFPPFAEAFGIEEGSPMGRPADSRAKVW